jgi:dTDP-4-dehydrorhamnose reductase
VRLDASFAPAVVDCLAQVRGQAVIYVAHRAADRAVVVDGAQAAASAASALGARFLYVSTDQVFDGERAPYGETAPAQPMLPHGRLKLEGEVMVRDAHPGAVVLRSSLMVGTSGERVYPPYEGPLLSAGLPVDAYVDEWRTPVLADDVARAAWELVLGETAGTFHIGGPERMSRYDLAMKVCEIHGFDAGLVSRAERSTDRPRDVSLDARRLSGLLGWAPRAIASHKADLDLARV